MRIVAVEEHFAHADLLARIDPEALAANGSRVNRASSRRHTPRMSESPVQPFPLRE